ncbi:cupin domain-containing protein [Bacillus sp. FJAT-29937]|uniref:cupin domain-containing protein n=1 Tax=Bacillus sp. FJAT-29937 TaxID=1720553 RepID=UPI00082E3A5D|nr:cupin domain-containing protein [Bacillus sp. FJAT-29937]
MKATRLKDIDGEKRSGATLKTIFDESIEEGGRTLFGTVTFPPGGRIPNEGTGSHEQDEYGIVIKGSLLIMSGGEEQRVSSGQAYFIPNKEEHWALNDREEDCEIVFSLVKR